MLKESIKEENCTDKGNDYYSSLTLKDFEELMKEVGMYFFKVEELEFTYPEASIPC